MRELHVYLNLRLDETVELPYGHPMQPPVSPAFSHMQNIFNDTCQSFSKPKHTGDTQPFESSTDVNFLTGAYQYSVFRYHPVKKLNVYGRGFSPKSKINF